MIQKNLQHAFRQLKRHPFFAFLTVISLTLGIGANTAVFSIVNAVLSRELPYKDPASLVSIWESNEELGWDKSRVAAANVLDWREQNTHFESIAAYTPWSLGLTVTETGNPEHVEVGLVTGDYFSVLGVDAAVGRTFVPEETWQGKDTVVVLDHGFWQRRFAGDPGVVGQTLRLNQQEMTIIGVMPERFKNLVEGMDLWATFGWDEAATKGSERLRRTHNLHAVGRLKAGSSPTQAETELKSIALQLEEIYPEINRGMGVGLTPLRDWLVGDTRTPLLILLGAVSLVLLISCVNLAHLLLARTAARSHELSMRVALGAGRWSIVGLLMTESLVLSFLGAIGGLFAGFALTKPFLAIDDEVIPKNFEVVLDHRVLLYTLALTILTALLFGLLPALRSSKIDAAGAMREGGSKASGSAGDRRGQDLLIISEVALAVMLIVGAGLLLRSLDKLFEVDSGFDSENVLTFKLSLPGSRYQDSTAAAFYEELTNRLAALSGVEESGAASLLPLTGQSWTGGFTIEGRSLDQDRRATLRNNAITPGYFAAMGSSLLDGRLFNTGDHDAAAKVLIINQSLAKTYFTNENPLGRRIAFDTDPSEETDWWTIVGLVEDQSQESLSNEPEPEVFRPHRQWVSTQMNVIVRTSVPPLSMVGEVGRTVRELDPELAIFDVETMEEIVLRSLGGKRFITWLMSAFAILALFQAAFGIYGVISYSVSRRVREFGIRLALGARSRQVVELVLRHGMIVLGLGVAAGLIASLFLTRVLSQQLYGVSRFDPVTFLFVAAFLFLVGFTASFIPARRVGRVDPAVSLRPE